MVNYSNLKKGSRVLGYELGPDYIKVWFEGKNEPKTFSNTKAGQNHIEAMKKMATEGQGLHRYIKRNVQELAD